LLPFIKICQNTPQLCWEDEWPTLSPGGRGLGGIYLIITPTLILPHQGGGKFFRELDAPQLCCGALHFYIFHELRVDKILLYLP